MSRRTLVIWNPNAGSSEKWEVLRGELRAAGADLRQPENRREAIATVEEAVRRGTRFVIAAGGDGTVSSVINGLCRAVPSPVRGEGRVRGDTVLGILPLGTGNDLCRTLGVPLDANEATTLLWPMLTGKPAELRPVDVIEAVSGGQTVFAANAISGGNAAEVGKQITAEMKQRWGPWCYVQGAITVMGGLNSYDTEIIFDGEPPQRHKTWAMVIANGRTVGGGVEVAPKADLEDGLMEVILILEATTIEAAIMTGNYLMGNFLEDERVIYRQARSVTITSEPDARFAADGEPLLAGPVHFMVRPRALRVAAPTPVKPRS